MLAFEHAQQADQGIQGIERAAFQVWPGGDAFDVAFAHGVAQQEPIQREAPGVGVVFRRMLALAVRGIQAPARAGRL